MKKSVSNFPYQEIFKIYREIMYVSNILICYGVLCFAVLFAFHNFGTFSSSKATSIIFVQFTSGNFVCVKSLLLRLARVAQFGLKYFKLLGILENSDFCTRLYVRVTPAGLDLLSVKNKPSVKVCF